MKKILTASLVAMMAVTAANADIASTKYVNDQTGASETGEFTFTNAAQGQTTLQGAVNAIAASLAANVGEGGSVQAQIDSALSAATADDFSETVKASLGKADNSVQTTDFNDFKTDNTQAIADAKQQAITTAGTNADDKISTAKAAMKLDATGGSGSFIQQVSQADGTVAATATAFVTTVDNTTKDSVIAPTTKAIKSYVDTEITALSGSNTALSGKVTALEEWKTTANTSIADNAGDIKDLQDADTAMDGRVDALEADNTTNKSNITSLQDAVNSINNAEAEGSVANKIAGVEADLGEVSTDLGEVSAANMGTTADTVVGAIKEVAGEAAAAQTAADNAQGEVDALEGVVAQQKTELQKAITDGDAATLASAKEDATTKADAAKDAAISDAAGKYQVKSSKLSIGGANGTWTDLTTTEVGYNASGTYSLVLKEGQIKWEKVSY